MWKIALGFVVFAALALYMLSRGGDIDLGGEKHGSVKTSERANAPGDGKCGWACHKCAHATPHRNAERCGET